MESATVLWFVALAFAATAIVPDLLLTPAKWISRRRGADESSFDALPVHIWIRASGSVGAIVAGFLAVIATIHAVKG